MPELTLRDGMVIVGSLLILAVMVDAWRRMRQQRTRIRMKLAETPPETDGSDDDISMFRELPNGGARVVSRSDYAGPLDDLEPRKPASPEQAASPPTTRSPEVDEEKISRSPSPATPQATPVPNGGVAIGVETTKSIDHGADLGMEADDASSTAAADDGSQGAMGEGAATTPKEATGASDGDSVLAGVSAADDEPANLDWLVDLPATQEESHAEGIELPRDLSTEVIMLHVMARDERGFSGKSILEILLACDLRFGDMSFFHRHEQEAGRGPIQFSVANMLQPGVFDIDNMDQLRTRGLVFFLTLPGPEDMIQAFDYMLETARAVARNLDGELLDESRSVLTQQCVEHYRQQIREFERRLLAQPSA